MSSFAHITNKLVFNPTLNVELPPSWNRLFSAATQPRPDTSLPGVLREVHKNDSKAIHGEIWSVPALAQAAPNPHQKVTSGSFQLYVISGVDSVCKNSHEIFIRPGEKVTFRAGDTFSFAHTTDLKLAILNEAAHFVECAAPAPIATLRIPSNADVEATRATLGLRSAQPSHYPSQAGRGEEVSSRAYRGNRRPY